MNQGAGAFVVLGLGFRGVGVRGLGCRIFRLKG